MGSRVSEIVTRWSVCTWLLGVCWKGEGGGGGGGGEEEEGLFKADAVNEEDPERDRSRYPGGGGGFIDKQRMNVGR